MASRRLRRRSFLKAAATGMAVPALLQAAESSQGLRGANERLALGVIGVGGRGEVLLKQAAQIPGVAIAAVCDVDQAHLDKAFKLAGGKAVSFKDYRSILDRRDIDAVIIGTPDHWHALQTIHACQAGKDVYCEKPLSHTLAEGRAMIRAARDNGRVVQVGTQHRTDPGIRRPCEWVRSGRIGKVHRIDMWMWENPVEPIAPGSDPPAGLDWDMWLGPAPRVPYHEKRCHFNFRWFRDYAGGYMTDWGAHMVNVVTFAMDADLAGPVQVEGREMLHEENLYEFPKAQEVRWIFKQPDFVLTWRQPTPAEETEKYGIRFHGSEGVVEVWFFGKYRLLRDGQEVADEPLPGEQAGDVQLPAPDDNMIDWLEAIRTRSNPINDIEIGHANAAVCHLGNIAAQLGRKLRWDPQQELFTGDPEANSLLTRQYRQPWSI